MPPDRELPNSALRLLFLSAEEVMGADGMQAMLNGAHMPQYLGHYPPDNLEYGATFSQYGRVEQAIEDLYGPRGARAILLRVGRRSFQYGLKEQPAALGLAGQALKSLPVLSLDAKMRFLLGQMLAAATKTANQPAHMEEDGESFMVVIGRFVCEYRPRHQRPCCLVTVGAFAEAMQWVTNRQFDVQEITCLNLGADACRYRIPKKPID
jgi:predicted hydrocarbon binding protein